MFLWVLKKTTFISVPTSCPMDFLAVPSAASVELGYGEPYKVDEVAARCTKELVTDNKRVLSR